MPAHRYRFGEFELDATDQHLTRGGEEVRLQPKVYDALCLFVRRPGVLLRREELMRLLWPDTTVTGASLDQTIYKLRAGLGDGGASRMLRTESRRGFRFVAEVREVIESAEPVDLAPRAGPLQRVFGRAAERAHIEALLAQDTGIVTVVGPGGVGKTTLAREVLAGASGDRWFVDLADAAPSPWTRVAAALGLSLGAEPVPGAVARELARRGPCLVVLDDFDAVVAHAADVAAWCRAAPGARFLVTSRERLRVAGERCVDLGPLGDDAAIALLRDRLDATRPGLGGSFSDARLRPLVRRLEGFPLAIELAATRVVLFGPEALLERLERGQEVLGGGRRDAPARHRSLDATLRWSWTLLDPGEQAVLAQCSVFRGGFGVGAAQQVIGGAHLVDQLVDLADKSLLRLGGDGRIGMYDMVRAFAADRLGELGLHAATRERHDAWAASVAEAVLDLEGDPSGWRVEIPNLRAAFERSVGPAAKLRLGRALGRLSASVAPHDDLVALADAGVQAAELLGPGELVDALLDRARVRLLQRQDRLAEPDAARALGLAGTDLARKGRALAMAGVVAGRMARLDEAERLYAEAVVAFDAAGAVVGSLMAAANLAAVRAERGDGRAVIDEYRRQADIWRRLGRPVFEGRALLNLGNALAGRQDPEADRVLERARAVFEEGGVVGGAATASLALAMVLQDRAEFGRASELATAALAEHRRTGDHHGVSRALRRLGHLQSEDGDLDEAVRLLSQAVEAAERHEDGRDLVDALTGLAAVRAVVGEVDAAIALFDRSIGVATREADRAGAAMATALRALVEALRGGDPGDLPGDSDVADIVGAVRAVVDGHVEAYVRAVRTRPGPSRLELRYALRLVARARGAHERG